MAQREKEETEFNVPEALRCLKPAGIISPAVISGHDLPKQRSPRSSRKRQLPESEKEAASDALEKLSSPLIRQSNRCSGCKRKVGLIGFRCRCGNLFCAEHRYSDRHSCSFDYKAAGKEAIERENPVIRAAKIVRI